MAFLIKEKQCAVLLALKDTSKTWYASNLARQAKTTYVFTSKLLLAFKKTGFVKLEQKGKLNTASLTEKGAQLAGLMEDICRRLEQAKLQSEQI
ncbi:hypothetical protein FJZ26_01520 [Candidatus Parvarchaeota archaeon]|nr:hypothetical protein [Candidatus Parvarchaeota archaeon]